MVINNEFVNEERTNEEKVDIKDVNILTNQSGSPDNHDPKESSASKAFEQLLFKVGDYGFFQWKLTIVSGFCGLLTGSHNISAVFLAASPDHWCNIPFFKERNISLGKEELNYTAPWILGKEGKMKPSKCSYLDYNYSTIFETELEYSEGNVSSVDFSSLESQPVPNTTFCSDWTYDDSIFRTTVVTEWNLVCDNRWMMSSTQSTFMLGILTGAVVFSAVSDKLGRRTSSLICCCLFFVASVSTAFTYSFGLFLLLRFIVAGTGHGVYLSNFVLVTESVSLKGRNVMGNLYHIFFAIGFLVLSGLGYVIRDWRNLQLVISLPSAVLLGYYWLLPESSRWLLMKGKEAEGIKALRVIAEANKRPFPSKEELRPLLAIISDEIKKKEHLTILRKMQSVLSSVVKLVRTPNMRRRNLISFYLWFVTAMAYYGLPFSGHNLNAEPYAIVALSAAAEFPSILFVILLLFRVERKTLLGVCFAIGGLACIAIMFLPPEMVAGNLAMVTIGGFFFTSCFNLIFLVSTELVPTHVRNIAVGMSSMFARIGSGIAPYLVDLLGDVYYSIPSTVFGVLSILAALLSLLLPGTGDKQLPESIAEIEAMPR